MVRNRRNFLKKAAITAPGIALIGTAQGMSGRGILNEPEQLLIKNMMMDGLMQGNAERRARHIVQLLLQKTGQGRSL